MAARNVDLLSWLLGTLVVRTGRLGPAIVAHMVFNAIATVGLYADSVHRH